MVVNVRYRYLFTVIHVSVAQHLAHARPRRRTVSKQQPGPVFSAVTQAFWTEYLWIKNEDQSNTETCSRSKAVSIDACLINMTHVRHHLGCVHANTSHTTQTHTSHTLNKHSCAVYTSVSTYIRKEWKLRKLVLLLHIGESNSMRLLFNARVPQHSANDVVDDAPRQLIPPSYTRAIVLPYAMRRDKRSLSL